MNGTVAEFDGDAGLGTIVAEDGSTYRFHCAEITDGTRRIGVNAVVEFELIAKLGEYEAGCVRKR